MEAAAEITEAHKQSGMKSGAHGTLLVPECPPGHTGTPFPGVSRSIPASLGMGRWQEEVWCRTRPRWWHAHFTAEQGVVLQL